MTPQEYFVADNIRLSYIQTDKFKAEAVTLSFDIPLTPENYIHSHVLCKLLIRGCERLPSIAQINRELDELYSATLTVSANAAADVISVRIGADVLSERFVTDGTDVLRRVLCTGADVLLRPILVDGTFSKETLDKVIVSFTDQVRSIKNSPKQYAFTRLDELLSRSKPCVVTYEYLLENAQKVTPESLMRFYTYLLSSTSINAFYIGASSPERVADAILNAFSTFSGKAALTPTLPVIAKPEEYISVTEEMDITQGNLAMGFRTGAGYANGKQHVLRIFNEIFGASPASKLFLNVRERMSLCYYCTSAVSASSGNLTVRLGLENKNRDVAKAEILRQLDLIRQGEISDSEMLAARQSVEYTFSQIYDSPHALFSFYSARQNASVSETVEEYKQKLLSVTAEEVCELAKNTVLDTEFYIKGTCAESEEADDE
jgi:predicted Zn-dependent peptidase